MTRLRACELLYPGLPADEAYRRHPQQIDRVSAELDRLDDRYREVETELRELAGAALRSGKR